MKYPLFCVVALSAATAAADELDEPEPEPATRSPGFTSMLRQDGRSRLGADLTYIPADPGAWKLDLHGHIVDQRNGGGIYLQVPLAYGDNTTGADTPNTTGVKLGNIELGAVFIPPQSTPSFGLVLRAGISLATSDHDLAAESALLRAIDLYAADQHATVARVAVSPMFRSGDRFARIDVGIDISVHTSGFGNFPKAGFFGALGGGIDFGEVALMGELAAITATGFDVLYKTGALSLRHRGGFYAAVMVGLEGTELLPGALVGFEALR